MTYVYHDTPTGLVDAMEKRVKAVFEEYVADARKKQKV